MNTKATLIDKILNNKVLSLILIILAVSGTLVTIYSAFFSEKKASLKFIELSSTNVLDINADISNLDILFDGISLKDNNENIRIINLKMINTGNSTITNDFYDDNDPVGVKLKNGVLIDKPILITASNKYLDKKLNNIPFDTLSIEFPKIILEKDEFFILRLMVLYKNDIVPEYISFGKVAGQNEIPILETLEENKLPFLLDVFHGGVIIQLVRLFSYFVIGLGITILFITYYFKLDDRKKRKKRKEIVNKFKCETDFLFTQIHNSIFNRFIEDGDYFLQPMYVMTEDENKLNDLFKVLLSKTEKKSKSSFKIVLKKLDKKPVFPQNDNKDKLSDIYQSSQEEYWSLLREMISDDVVYIDENETLKINNSMRTVLKLFMDYLINYSSYTPKGLTIYNINNE